MGNDLEVRVKNAEDDVEAEPGDEEIASPIAAGEGENSRDEREGIDQDRDEHVLDEILRCEIAGRIRGILPDSDDSGRNRDDTEEDEKPA